MSHYYSQKQENIVSNEKTISFTFENNLFTFITDNGVFCKDYIDFGSKTLLKAFVPNSIDAPVLDMGCGYGTLGVIISKLYNKEVCMFDVNERAVELCAKNIIKNKVSAKVFQHDIMNGLEVKGYSACVTNPPIRAGKKVVFKMYEEAHKVLVNNGELFVVIQKKQGAPSSKEYINSLFGNCDILLKDAGYYILHAIKIEN